MRVLRRRVYPAQKRSTAAIILLLNPLPISDVVRATAESTTVFRYGFPSARVDVLTTLNIVRHETEPCSRISIVWKFAYADTRVSWQTVFSPPPLNVSGSTCFDAWARSTRTKDTVRNVGLLAIQNGDTCRTHIKRTIFAVILRRIRE